MKSTVRRIAAPLTALVLAAALSSCGGGDDSGASSEKKSVTLWMYPVIGDQAASDAYWTEGREGLRGRQLRHRPEDRAAAVGRTATRSSRPRSPARRARTSCCRSRTRSRSTSRTARSSRSTTWSSRTRTSSCRPRSRGLTVDGKVYGAPIYHTVTTTIYNKKLLTKAGITKPPETWDEIKAAAPKLKAAGVLHAGLLRLAGGVAEPELLPAAVAGRRQGVRRRRQDGRLQPGARVVEALTFLKTCTTRARSRRAP